jgi:hypothetical protein
MFNTKALFNPGLFFYWVDRYSNKDGDYYLKPFKVRDGEVRNM